MQRVLLRLDEAAVLDALAGQELAEARLELEIAGLGSGWADGGSISLHRLTQPFAEGGATWNCANDRHPENSQLDCDGADAWEMDSKSPPWEPAASAVAIVTDSSTAAVSLDVTRDVQELLSGGPNRGWILKRAAEISGGNVDFHARESASEPRLVVSVPCSPETDAEFCQRLGFECGDAEGMDNCDRQRLAVCGDCAALESCGGGGQANVCGCTPTTCEAQGANCGVIDDGCGASLLCGDCTAPESCGGGGAPNSCGCTPTTCEMAGVSCGTVSDGCGNTLVCGTCAGPTLAAIGDQTVAVGAALTLQLGASDADGDPLLFSAEPLPLPANATLDGQAGLFAFRPDADQVGTLELTFRVSDGTSSAEETISITVTSQGPSHPTSVSGQVLDTNDFVQGTITPVVGATISFLGTAILTTTDITGGFTLSGVPAGEQVFDIDPSTAWPAPNGATYAGFREAFFVIDHVDNVVDRPFFLPRIDPASETVVDPNVTTVVTNPTLEISIVVPPHTAKNADGTDFTGTLSISEVPDGLAPAALPPELSPDPLITIQPVGVVFATPVAISFPNVDQLAPGNQVDIYSLDPATGEFGVVGTGEVSADGSRIETIAGGVRAADWHANLSPGAGGNLNGEANDCSVESGSRTSLSSGVLLVEHATPDYVSQGQSRAIRLVYTSGQAAPAPVISAATTILERAAVPPLTSISEVTVGGVVASGAVFTDTSTLSEDTDETFRQVAQFDASGFATGVYELGVAITSHYPRSAVKTTVNDTVAINNQRGSAFGAGWTIAGLARIHTQTDGSVALVDGEGEALDFGRGAPAGGVSTDVAIDGRSNVFGAGKTTAPGPRGGGGGLLPPLVALEGSGVVVTFPEVSGLVSGFTQGCPFVGPDGGSGCGLETDVGSFEGISGILLDGATMFLAGVFIDDSVPADPSPPRLDFTGIANTATDVTPELGQTFFVGDGRTASGVLQQFHAPPGATRLYLGFIETFGFDNGGLPGFYNDNGGSLDARVETLEGGPGADVVRVFTSPPGEFSELVRNADGTYTMTEPDRTQTQFDTEGLQTERADPNGNTTVWAYDAGGRLLSVTDPVGKLTQFAYTGGLLSSITDPAGRVTSFVHDTENNLTQITSPDGGQRRFTYDAGHRMTSQVSPLGFATIYEFDVFGKHRKSIWPDGSERTIAGSSAFGLVDAASDIGTPANPAPLVRQEDVIASFVDGEGRPPIELGTDAIERIDSVTDSAGFATDAVLDDNDQAVSMSFPSGNSVTSAYDGSGNRVSHSDAIFGVQTSRVYEAPFNTLASRTNVDGTTQYGYLGPNLASRTSPLGRTTSFTHDARGNRTSSTGPDGVESRVLYDADDNAREFQVGLAADQRVTVSTRTSEGYVASTTDPLGRVTTFAYDQNGRLVTQALPDGRVVARTFDATGRVSTVTPPGRPPHGFAYTSTDQLAQYLPPGVGLFNPDTQYEYNRAQQLTQVFRPDGTSIDIAYDSFGRTASISTLHDQLIFAYGAGNGLLVSVANSDGTLSMTYRGSLADSVDSAFGFASGTVSAHHDARLRVDELTVAGTPPVAYVYDADGAMISAGDLTFTRDSASGLVTSATLGAITDSWGYNAFGEIDHYDTGQGGSVLFSYDLASDALGRIEQVLETIDDQTHALAYAYDLAGRLDSVTRDGVVVEDYSYDENDNRETAVTEAGSISATYDAQDRLLTYGDATFTYSANGEIASKTDSAGTTLYDYDALGNLRGVTLPDGSVIEYTIDGDNRRVGKTVDGTPVRGWLYKDDLNPVAELDGAGNIISLFVYGTWSHAPDYMVRGGQTYRIVTDRRGSVRLVVDIATGSIAARRDYDSFGRVTLETNPDFQPFGFVGGLYDRDTGLVRFGARDYDATTGRWTAKDPSLFRGGPNLYRYANNDPVNLTDREGLKPCATTVDCFCTPRLAQCAAAGIIGGGSGAGVGAAVGGGAVAVGAGTVAGGICAVVGATAFPVDAVGPRRHPAPRTEQEERTDPRTDPITPNTRPDPKRGCTYNDGTAIFGDVPYGRDMRTFRLPPSASQRVNCPCHCGGHPYRDPPVEYHDGGFVLRGDTAAADERCHTICEAL